MDLKALYFHQAILEYKFRDGYRFFDVPGEILQRWAGKFDPEYRIDGTGVKLHRASDNFSVEVNAHRIGLTMIEVSTVDYFRDHAVPVVEDLIGLLDPKTPERVGFRVQYLLIADPVKACRLIEERLLSNAKPVIDALGQTGIGSGLTVQHENSEGYRHRLHVTTGRVEKKPPDRAKETKEGVVFDFDFGSERVSLPWNARSFINSGSNVFKDKIFPLLSSILGDLK